LIVAGATSLAAMELISDFGSSAATSSRGSSSVCERYPDTRRANMTALVLSYFMGAMAFAAASTWLHLMGAHPRFAPDSGQAEVEAAMVHHSTSYYAWRHRQMMGPHVAMMMLTLLIWAILPFFHTCFTVLTQAATGNILISLSSRLITGCMEDRVQAANTDCFIRNGKVIATASLILWLAFQWQQLVLAIDPVSEETSEHIKSGLRFCMSKLTLPTIGEDSEPEVLMEAFLDCPRIDSINNSLQDGHALLRVPMQAIQGAIAGIGGFAGASSRLSGYAIFAMLMWNVGPVIQCTSSLDKHALWSGPCFPVALLELSTTVAAFVVMLLWAGLTLGVVEHELYCRHSKPNHPAALLPSTIPPKPPEILICPITLELMHDPAATADGQVYERAAIQAWLDEHDESPLTGVRLEHKGLISIPVIRSACLEFMEGKEPSP